MKRIIIGLNILFATSLGANEAIYLTLPNVKQIVNLEVEKPSLSDAIKINTEIPMEKIKEQLKDRRSGDDVGNGGDLLRSKLKEDMTSIQNDTGLNLGALKSYLVVEDLGISYAVVNSDDGKIALIDKELWEQGYANGLDMRAQILSIAKELGLRIDVMDIYSSLSVKSGRPYCASQGALSNINRTSKTFNGEHRTLVTAAEEQALGACEDSDYSGCHITKSQFSGFMSAAKYRVEVKGYKSSQKSISRSEKMKLLCSAALECEELTLFAPYGQVSPSEFDVVGEKVKIYCN